MKKVAVYLLVVGGFCFLVYQLLELGRVVGHRQCQLENPVKSAK